MKTKIIPTKAVFAVMLAVSAVAPAQVSTPSSVAPRVPAAPLPQRAEQPSSPPPRGDAMNQAFQHAGGSLYQLTAASAEPGQSDTSLFAVPKPDPKRIKKHDLVTVIVKEESDSQTKATTDTKKTADFNAILQNYMYLQGLNAHTRTPKTPPQLQFSADRNFKGEGTVDRSDTLTARIQAEVMDVKPNGTLVLQATKQIKMDDEEIHMTLTGVVRAEDVTIDNSVLSTQLADLQLAKTTKGAARDASKRGFIVQFFDAINPF